MELATGDGICREAGKVSVGVQRTRGNESNKGEDEDNEWIKAAHGCDSG
jgi:hypothetical protein